MGMVAAIFKSRRKENYHCGNCASIYILYNFSTWWLSNNFKPQRALITRKEHNRSSSPNLAQYSAKKFKKTWTRYKIKNVSTWFVSKFSIRKQNNFWWETNALFIVATDKVIKTVKPQIAPVIYRYRNQRVCSPAI